MTQKLGSPRLSIDGEEGTRGAYRRFGVRADDYLTKPFSPRELVLRVQAILRRAREPGQISSGSQVLQRGPPFIWM
ncbi:MAG: hypothetical protein Ct9H300mP15_05030 [Gemmatimonadota bacterium]|nr:MAG: hypothetical protein Ct9H300mP15_05030 [Gemmatimonadota bacterium]